MTIAAPLCQCEPSFKPNAELIQSALYINKYITLRHKPVYNSDKRLVGYQRLDRRIRENTGIWITNYRISDLKTIGCPASCLWLPERHVNTRRSCPNNAYLHKTGAWVLELFAVTFSPFSLEMCVFFCKDEHLFYLVSFISSLMTKYNQFATGNQSVC